ncbi:MAG: TasA family protein [Umezawaea sp.]
MANHSLPVTRRRRSAWRPIAFAAVALSAVAAIGGGVWATLSATTANGTPEQVTSGTLKLTMAANGAGFDQAVANLAPGDVVNRYVDLTSGGSLDAQALTLQVAATGSANLVTDGTTTKALRVTVRQCASGTWNAATGVCGGTTSTLLAATPLSTLSGAQTLVPGAVVAGAVQHLQVSVQLPDQNETTVNGVLPAATIQGLTANLTYTFAEAQRTATTSNS